MNKLQNHRPTVAIVGAGFGGLNAAKELRNDEVDVVLIDRRNFHLFQPLLYQVASSALSPSDIAYPVRAVFHRQKNLDFNLARVDQVDFENKCLKTDVCDIGYDYLIVATGSVSNFFGIQGVERHGFELKHLENATDIRNHILRMFERATVAEDPLECDRLRTIVIVGGGPTGVECAGAFSELISQVLKKDFPELDVADFHIVLLEAFDRVLAGFPDELSRGAAERLRMKGVQVRFQAAVADYDGEQVTLKTGETIPAKTLIWAAGVRAEDLANRIGVKQGRQGRIIVDTTLQLPGQPDVFVIGDIAYLEDEGAPLPMVAPVAIQQAKTAVKNIRRRMNGQVPLPFEYKDPGSLATIGRSAAVAQVKDFKFQGFLAWLVWLAVHLVWLIGFRNRAVVLVNWAWDYLFYERAIRLIFPAESKDC